CLLALIQTHQAEPIDTPPRFSRRKRYTRRASELKRRIAHSYRSARSNPSAQSCRSLPVRIHERLRRDYRPDPARSRLFVQATSARGQQSQAKIQNQVQVRTATAFHRAWASQNDPRRGVPGDKAMLRQLHVRNGYSRATPAPHRYALIVVTNLQ